jgi:hypothetical protein
MKIPSTEEQLSKLKSLKSESPIEVLIQGPVLDLVVSAAKLTSASEKSASFSLPANGTLTVHWSPVGECEEMFLEKPEEHHLNYQFKNGLRLKLTQRPEKKGSRAAASV